METGAIAVLVVEDEPLVRMGIVAELLAQDFVVFEAASAAEAIALLEANSAIHVMFTDVDMPGGMDGLALAAAVRDRWPPVRIIVTSGHRRLADAELPIRGRFLRKPYQSRAVAAAIRAELAQG